MTKSTKFAAAVLAVMMALCLMLPACAEEVIKIGGIAPLTGPYAVYGISVKNGADLYVAQLNENGGIDGKMVQLDWQELGITEVFGAYSAKEAREVLEREKIDFLLTTTIYDRISKTIS